MIGLEKNAVRLAQHDPSWIALGRTECDLIKRACPNLVIDVQHVGSTAVPELPAKPILDIAAGIDAKSWPSVKTPIKW